MKPSRRVLVVDDELPMAEMLADGLADRGYEAVPISSSERAAEMLRRERFDAVVTDLRMPKVDGLALLGVAREVSADTPVIVMTAYGAIESAIDSIRLGAYHYLTKPFSLEELALFLGRGIEERDLRREAARLRTALGQRFSRSAIVGESKAMRDVFEVLDRVADADVPVLLSGETGTGKGLVARTLHAESARSKGRFVTINCAALPADLLESELFGHDKGAFTGAMREREGLVVEAEGGTLFLDEIAELAPALQAKLLDLIERRVVRRVGSTKEREVDVRVVAATHKDLAELARKGAFRDDLRYRLEVVVVDLPPLRRRREDIPLLVERFLAAAREKYPQATVKGFSRDAMARLLDYSFPGNVRELAHIVERGVLLGRGEAIGAAELPIVEAQKDRTLSFEGEILPIRVLQRRYAAWALEQCANHKTRTADKLGVDLKTLAKWLSVDEET